MIVYKIDKQTNLSANARIRDMLQVLEEIPASLKILQEVLGQHANSISTPALDDYRGKLQQMVSVATELTKTVAEKANHLSSASDRVTKHLISVDEQSTAALRDAETKSTQTSNSSNQRLNLPTAQADTNVTAVDKEQAAALPVEV